MRVESTTMWAEAEVMPEGEICYVSYGELGSEGYTEERIGHFIEGEYPRTESRLREVLESIVE